MSCNKIAFESKSEAKKYLKDKRYRCNMRGTLKIYKCWCGQWHYTSQSAVESRRKTKEFKRKYKKD